MGMKWRYQEWAKNCKDELESLRMDWNISVLIVSDFGSRIGPVEVEEFCQEANHIPLTQELEKRREDPGGGGVPAGLADASKQDESTLW